MKYVVSVGGETGQLPFSQMAQHQVFFARHVKSVFVSSLLDGKVMMVGLFPSIPCCARLRDGAVFVRAVGAGLLLASDETQFNR